ncbi:MAG TPA: hypothetical protein VIA18_01190 [Polyangia bacterium]|jgi:hypothetical protein|nr:hypothetical protein [Polyangia bacterium]HWE28396.1 hypothetical protein [Polyangia bacterium]
MRIAVVLLFASGCAYFGGGMNGPTSQNEPLAKEEIEQLDVTLVSRCPKPTRVCYSGDKCLTLVRGKPKRLRASTAGTGEVLVSLEGSSANVYADTTFSTVELDESCGKLARKIAHN